MRLGFHYHIPAYQDAAGQLMTLGPQGLFLDSLASRCDQLVCFLHTPRRDELPQMDYALQCPNIAWVNLGPHCSVPRRALLGDWIVRPVRRALPSLDVLLIRGPSPLLPAMARAAGDVPLALLLVGDYVAGVDHLAKPHPLKVAIKLLAHWNRHQQRRVSQRALTFVNTRKLYEELRPHVPNLYETRTTTLTEADFYEREDTCTAPPFRLLYTGRMDRAKGLFQMVEAVAWLVERGEDVILDLVGWVHKQDTIIDEIYRLARDKGVSQRVLYHGFKSVGEDLFAYYRRADLYVIASSAEGFPRTIWEAIAHSLPVVATRVGSIPMFLKDRHTAMLVEPGDSLQLAQAISETLHDKALRIAMIDQGRRLARQNTLEARSAELIAEMESWLRRRGSRG